MKRNGKRNPIETLALFLTSFIWTMVVCSAPALVLLHQEGWANPPYRPQVAQAAPLVPLLAPLQPGLQLPSNIPTPTAFPTPVPTRVVPLPEMLPEMQDPPEQVAGNEAVDTAPVEIPLPAKVLLPPPPLTPDQRAAMPTHVVIPAAQVDSGVIPVGWHTIERNGQLTSVWQVAENAVGWHQTSGLPGQPGNTVLVAHSNSGGEVFRHLDRVNPGDEIALYVGNQARIYRIEMTTIVQEAGQPAEVRRQNAQWIAPTPDERLTLVTCWPYPASTHRLIVVARPVM